MIRRADPGHRPTLSECDGFLLAASVAAEKRPDIPRRFIVAAGLSRSSRAAMLYARGYPVEAIDVVDAARAAMRAPPVRSNHKPQR